MQEKLYSFLSDWALNFIKNRDVILKKLEKIEKITGIFDVHAKYKDKEQNFMVCSYFEQVKDRINSIGHSENFSIITLNSKKNLDYLIANWKNFSEFSKLSIIFANPYSGLDKKWIIAPHIHNKICDESSLKLGLKSMFDMVEPIEEDEIELKISS